MDTFTHHGGKAYILTFTDDFTRRSWVRLLARKDEVLEHLRDWIALVERQSEKKVKTPEVDKGPATDRQVYGKIMQSSR